MHIVLCTRHPFEDRATGYNGVAIPLAADVLFAWEIILSPAVGAVLISLSTVIVAINVRFL